MVHEFVSEERQYDTAQDVTCDDGELDEIYIDEVEAHLHPRHRA